MAAVTDIDEALLYASLVPTVDRGTFWRNWVDSLLEQRNRLTGDTITDLEDILAMKENA